MKVSYNALNTFFDGKLPAPQVVARALTFHAWEIEGVEERDGDTVLDVKVLPDKSAWALSHRGVAKDLSVILSIPLAHDPLMEAPVLEPKAQSLSVAIDTPICRRYSAAYIRGVKVGPTPEWMQEILQAIGQKSINNVVDVTNYVMFMVGQPLHAFDAKRLNTTAIKVRAAKDGEEIVTLSGDTFTLTSSDCVITDGVSGEPVGIGGIKGGKAAEIDASTTDIILESANFDPVSIRKTSQRLRLRTDASTRFENGIVPGMTIYSLRDAVTLILELSGGTLEGYCDVYGSERAAVRVEVSLGKINGVLGLGLTTADVSAILDRFGYTYETSGENFSVTAPFERPDLVIAEDVIEEIGRIYGYEHVPTVIPEPLPLSEVNQRFAYAEQVRDELSRHGFSEILTSSFREHDNIKLANALASDKGYLRSRLRDNMDEALAKNAPNADLLGMREIRAYEIGTVFTENGEHISLAIGVRSPSGYKAKHDDPILKSAIEGLESERELNTKIEGEMKDGIFETNFDELVTRLPKQEAYWPHKKRKEITYKPFSLYPFISRDIAFWTPEEVTAEQAEEIIRREAGDLMVQLDLFDVFKKDGKQSLAFRLVFQSPERTLESKDADSAMERVTSLVKEQGWEVR